MSTLARASVRTASLLLLFVPVIPAQLVKTCGLATRDGDFSSARQLVEQYRVARGTTPELAAAVSWLARGELGAKDYRQAERYAAEARQMALDLSKQGGPDSDRNLATALGASIEVRGQALAAQGALSEAISFLNGELARWSDTSLHARIQKNIHLLSLEGKPAPPLDLSEHLGANPVALSALDGKVVLLFFWAHWCPDCKAEAPVLGRLAAEFGDRGLVIVGPTQLYGYVARGRDADPAEELAYIDSVRRQYYSAAGDMPVPVNSENFANYGSSTTPTLVLIDRQGIVRLYHPGEMSYEELASRIRALL